MDQSKNTYSNRSYSMTGFIFVLLMANRSYVTVRLGLIQLFKLFLTLKVLFVKNEEEYNSEGGVTNFAALCTALADTISYSYVLYQYCNQKCFYGHH